MRVIGRWVSTMGVAAGLTLSLTPPLTAQASRPTDTTAECNDGSYSKAKTERGACSGHGGVKTWFGETKADVKAAGKDASKPAKDVGKATESSAKPKDAAKPVVASAPAHATGQCRDGTYTRAKTQRGACSGHGGVATWLADANATATSKGITPSPAAPAPPPAATTNRPGATPAPAPTTSDAGGAKIQTPPADAPPNATAQCNDGTFSLAKQHRGACSGHKGVKAWFK
jgi:hypothetical protein